MAYQINKTDGTVVATVADGQIDTLSTDITLIGKNYSGFGEALNENFVKLLENFSSTTRPSRPVKGQIWFDSAELKLKVYSGTEFLPVSSATIAGTQPATLGVGDLWFNNVDSQLYFYDGNSPILLGPSYSTSQGVSGLRVASILDTLNQTRVITYLYNNGILLGIFAKDSFTPKNAIIGFSGSVNPGFNAGNLTGLKFNVTATNAENLGGVVANTYVRKDTSNTMAGQLTITTDLGIVLGGAGQANLKVNSGNVTLSNASTDNDLILNVRRGIDQEDAIRIGAANRVVDFYPGGKTFPTPQINVGGNLTISGNLTVEGTTTTVNSTVLEITDVNIVLANGNSTDAGAHEGGLILKGTDDHIWMWADVNEVATGSRPALLSKAWNSSDSINLAKNKYLAIDGVPVIEQTNDVDGFQTFRLTEAVTSLPGISEFGTQIFVEVGPIELLTGDPVAEMLLETNSVSGNPRISTIVGNKNLELAPDGIGNVALIGSPKITGLADPIDAQDAATKEYVDNVAELRPIALSIDLSDGKSNNWIIENVLNKLVPEYEIDIITGDTIDPPRRLYRVGTVVNMLVTILNNSTTSLDINPLVQAGRSYGEFITPVMPGSTVPGGTANALTNLSVGIATVTAPNISPQRFIRYFRLEDGGWEFKREETVIS